MRILVSAPNNGLAKGDVEQIHKDLEKIERRLSDWHQEVTAEVRVTKPDGGMPGHHVVIELHYGRNHLIAKEDGTDVGLAVRTAREEILRQIKDRSRGGHSSFAKGF
jgi:ribosome-associated translation inhibitor RaiA